jgi:hypothetical protein
MSKQTRGGARPGAGRKKGSLRGRNVANYSYTLTPETHNEILQRCEQHQQQTGEKVTRGQYIAILLNITRQ